MQFVVGDIPRFAFGFANPNHAAAAICAVAPFLWGWRRLAWVGWIASVGLAAMLAMTFSRTGLVVLAVEAVAWWWRRSTRGDGAEGIPHPRLKDSVIRLFGYSAVLLFLLVWMWPRMTIDGAILNRPKIWLAGLQLFAANPLGVGFGNSGLVASAFMLPDGVEVRTLVNSHLTMLVEGGFFVGCAWLVFVTAALLSRMAMPRTRIALAGLALSACSASVFDWHVLFGLGGAPDFGSLNLALSWLLFSAFVTMGFVLIVRGFAWRRVGIAAAAAVAAMLVAVACGRSGKDSASLVVADGFVAWGSGPWVYHDAEWSLKVLKERFPKGARIRIKDGVDDIETTGPDVWLFGEVAESAERFGDRKVTVVAPPDYYEPPANVAEVRSL